MWQSYQYEEWWHQFIDKQILIDGCQRGVIWFQKIIEYIQNLVFRCSKPISLLFKLGSIFTFPSCIRAAVSSSTCLHNMYLGGGGGVCSGGRKKGIRWEYFQPWVASSLACYLLSAIHRARLHALADPHQGTASRGSDWHLYQHTAAHHTAEATGGPFLIFRRNMFGSFTNILYKYFWGFNKLNN